jgi:hypothetical protein
MASFYGVKPKEIATSVATPTTADSGVVIAIGTAPIHQVGGKANEIVIANTYDEAVSALGYSDDWDKYTLCEVMYSHFKLYGMAPIILVNVLDPTSKAKEVTAQTMAITSGQIALTGDAIGDTITVKNGSTTYVAGTDYDVFYEDGQCIVEVLSGGAMDTAGITSAQVSYSEVSFELADMKNAVIGGFDTKTGQSTGMELVDMAYFKGQVLPDILIAPGFSSDPEVAAVMGAKTTFSGVFKGVCLCDFDTTENRDYQAAAAAKAASGSFQQTKQIVCWPMLGLGDRVFHYSTQLASLMSATDEDNDNIPSESPSNKTLQADCAILEDGTEVLLDLTQANYLRGQGVATVCNFVNGFTAWGSYTACYPGNTDPKDMYINVTRMFNYVANTCVLSFWSRIDERMTSRFAESVVDELNMWLNGLKNDGHLLGCRVELKSDENPTTDLMAGIVRIHIYMTPPGPVQEVDFLEEYDVSYLSEVLGSTE